MAHCPRCGRYYREPLDEFGDHPCDCTYPVWEDDEATEVDEEEDDDD